MQKHLFTMVNSEKFSQRLQKIIDTHQLSASSFADKIGVQRSSISHILSGRNKPSLDFVMKVLHEFPEVELHWLLNGKGNFPSEANNAINESKQEKAPSIPKAESSKDIERIVIFYKDGTFKSFVN